jgi:hypothetical protein
MDTTTSPRQPTAPIGRRLGYSMAIVVNAILLELVNGWPGWGAVPFLTDAAAVVIVPVNVSLTVAIALNAANLILDRRWLRAAADLVSAALALLVLIILWDIFPFAFADPSIDWALVTRVVLGFSMGACVISIVGNTGVLINEAVGRPSPVRAEAG